MDDYEGKVEQVSPSEQFANTKEKQIPRRTKTGGGQGRKSHACTECKRLKMRCEPLPGERTCSRCVRRGLECQYDRRYNPAMALMPGACETRLDQMSKDIRNIQSALDSLLKQRSALVAQNDRQPSPTNSRSSKRSSKAGTVPSTNGTGPRPYSDDDSDAILSHPTTPRHMAMTRESSPVGRMSDDQINIARVVSMSEPMGSLYEVTRLRNLRFHQSYTPDSERSSEGPIVDFISKGVIKEAEAQRLYQNFCGSLNHYLWVGLEQIHDSLDSVRRSSTLLTATILTVSALHDSTCNETFDKCYGVFLHLISASMFARKHNVDDVRGLCIGAFWLSDVSWKLSGHAIRIATELGIHQSFQHALRGDREHFLRARLWYMLYVCDKHFSIAYGRPPMMSENAQIRDYELFLASENADILDYRIISQVALFQIINRVYDQLIQCSAYPQEEVAVMVPDNLLHLMRGFNLEIDQWQQHWTGRMENSKFIGEFPVVGITLYSYFGRLLLNSLALRGVNMTTDRLSAERREYTNMAISAAASIVSYVLEQKDLRRAMVGTPLYVHTMITWASVFLMKIATRWKVAGFSNEPTWVWALIDNMIQLLRNTMASDRHVLHYIADGLQKMLEKSRQAALVQADGRPPDHEPLEIKVEFNHDTTSPATVSVAHNMVCSQGGAVDGLYSIAHPAVSGHMSGVTATAWNPQYATCAAEIQQDPSAYDQMILNDSMISEAFGGAGYNMYDMLHTQFSHY